MKIVTMGEIMLRLSPAGFGRFIQASDFEAAYGGAEANVAVALAQWGEEAVLVSKIPENDIGQAALNELRKYGVKTQYISRGGHRMGIYYMEKGASGRPSKVVYDRKGSSFCEAESSDFDFDEIFSGCDWFHFTGITPALSDSAAGLTEEACKAAQKAGVPVSCDLNYRSSLWSKEKAGEVLSRLMEYVDVCITNAEQAEDVFGFQIQEIKNESYEEMLRITGMILSNRFTFKKIAFTQRENISATDNILSAALFGQGECCFSKRYPVHIVDRVGGGDAFAAGLIYSMLHKRTAAEIIEFAAAANCMKHTIEGDFLLAGADEVWELAQGKGEGRIVR